MGEIIHFEYEDEVWKKNRQKSQIILPSESFW